MRQFGARRYVSGRQAGEDKTDSLLNASAMHHKPDTFLQWIIATAERVASGFERKNSSGTTKPAVTKALIPAKPVETMIRRLLTLFEQISLNGEVRPSENAGLDYCYPLKPLSPEAIFPQWRDTAEPADNAQAQRIPRLVAGFSTQFGAFRLHTAATGIYGWTISVTYGKPTPKLFLRQPHLA